MYPIDRHGPEGFTLMEIMVAMMILALSLTAVLQLFSDGLRSGQLSKTYLLGVYHARAKMEEVLVVDEIIEEIRRGELADGFTWQVAVERQIDERAVNNSSGLVLFKVTVTVNWPERGHIKSYIIESLRLGPATLEKPS